MKDARFDIVAVGNALVDVIAQVGDGFIAEHRLAKGQMALIDAERALSLYAAMPPGIETSGGSAANTLAGMAMLGCRCAHIGQVAADQLGAVFAHDLRNAGVAFDTPARSGGAPTGRCLIAVTPDGQRTMSTLLGASAELAPEAIDHALIRDGAILFLEGYQWDSAGPRSAMRSAIDTAQAAGRKVALTLSAEFCVAAHGADWLALLKAGKIDILVGNEGEVTALARADDVEAAMAQIRAMVPLLVTTHGERGATAIRGGERVDVPAAKCERVVDTTGAGDLFAAGFLAGQAQAHDLKASLRLGALCAAECISHIGPRPQADLKTLARPLLG